MNISRKLAICVSALIGLIITAGATEARANTIYVATSGNDTNSGSINFPVASPARALALASTGDTVYFRAGHYTVARFLWIDKAHLTFSSYPGELASIEGTTTDATNLGSIWNVEADGISFINLEMQGGNYYVVKSESNTGFILRNCHIFGSGRDCIKMYNSDNAIIENCEIGPSGVRDPSNAEGIDSVGGRNTVVRGCYFHDIATNGLYLKGGASDCLVERNRLERLGAAGILLGQDTDLEFMRDGTQYECINSVARNNVVIGAQGAGVGTYSGLNIKFENNTLYDVSKAYNGGFYIATNSREVPSRQIAFKNNIVVVTSDRPMAFVINLADSIVCDSNIWFRPSGGAYKFYEELGSVGNYWTSFADWKSGMNADSKSLVVDPRLDSANLYKPLAGSPAIDTGESLLDVAGDYSGVTRPQGRGYDIGAYEVGASTPGNRPPTVSASGSPTSGNAPLTVSFASNASDSDGQVVSYNWTFGDGQTSPEANPSHLYTSVGTFNAIVTVTDNAGATATSTVPVTVNSAPGGGAGIQNVIWVNSVGCAINGSTLTKTSSSAWGNAGASSSQIIQSGDGFVEFTANETGLERMTGLSNGDPDQNYTSIGYGIHLNTGGAFYVCEKGTSRGYFGDYRSGDVFRVAVVSGHVKYSRNGTVFFTSSVTPSYPLLVDAALDGQGSTITNAVISSTMVGGGGGGGTPTPITIQTLTPTKGEVIKPGSVYNITWSVTGDSTPTRINHYTIDLSLDGGDTWSVVAANVAGGVTSYEWTAPSLKSKWAIIRISWFASNGDTGKTQTDIFTINKVKKVSR